MDLVTSGNAARETRLHFACTYMYIYIFYYYEYVYTLVCVYVCESETLEIAKTRRTKENRGDVREGPG